MSELLKITGLSKSFGRHIVFSGLNIKLTAGKVYGLLGLNGEGKTTLIRILLGSSPRTSDRSTIRTTPYHSDQPLIKRKSATSPRTPSSTAGCGLGSFWISTRLSIAAGTADGPRICSNIFPWTEKPGLKHSPAG